VKLRVPKHETYKKFHPYLAILKNKTLSKKFSTQKGRGKIHNTKVVEKFTTPKLWKILNRIFWSKTKMNRFSHKDS